MMIGSQKTKLEKGLLKGLTEAVAYEKAEMQLKETVIEQHHTHTLTVKESRDKWARRHAKLSASRNKTMINEMADVLNVQNERIHDVKDITHKLNKELDKLKMQLELLESRKPEEKHTVTENVIHVPVQQDKKLMMGVILAIVLSILGLVNK